MCIVGTDPVALGLIASLARPGGHVTGVTNNVGMAVPTKRLELLRQAVPSVARVAFLANTTNPTQIASFRELERAVAALGLELMWPELRDANSLHDAFAKIVQSNADAVFIAGEPFLQALRPQVIDYAATGRLPTVSADRRWIEAGALMGYAPNQPAQYARGAVYVAKLLNGAAPADLPVEQPTTFEFVINLKT